MKQSILVVIVLLCLPTAGFTQEADSLGGIPNQPSMQPETPVSEWTGKTILLIGGHPDDDAGSHGTLAMLKDHGNEVYVLILTTGNVGTKDPDMTRWQLAKIRRQEEVDALAALGIPEDHYINLGYTDGLLKFADDKAVLRRLVKWIRKIQPDVLFAFDPGYGYQVWHKTDHRGAAYLAADAARMAEWRLLFPGQIIHWGLEAWWIPEYMLFGGLEKDQNLCVDISGYEDAKKEAWSKYISQYSAAWNDYTGPDLEDLDPEARAEFEERIENSVNYKDGTPVECFRYYHGIPDGIGKRR